MIDLACPLERKYFIKEEERESYFDMKLKQECRPDTSFEGKKVEGPHVDQRYRHTSYQPRCRGRHTLPNVGVSLCANQCSQKKKRLNPEPVDQSWRAILRNDDEQGLRFHWDLNFGEILWREKLQPRLGDRWQPVWVPALSLLRTDHLIIRPRNALQSLYHSR